MEIDTVEKDGRMIINLEQNHTIANLIRKAVWANGAEAGYDKGHPLGGESGLIIHGDDPKQTLEDAISTARDWMDDLEAEL